VSGEFAFLERVRERLPAPPPGEVWMGDDAAVLAGGVLFATDVLVAGVHFDLRWCTGADVGWKALAVNVSDVAAMGGAPRAAVVAVVVPPHPAGLADAVAAGIAEAAAALACPLVGGDTTSGAVLTVSVAIVGAAPDTGAVLRRGARAGDGVYVSGAVGGAKVALDARRSGRTPTAEAHARMVRPWPRVNAGAAAAAAGATAMIDISDGLVADLGHVLDASGIGVELDGDRIPRAAGASLEDALYGGDDYELCFTAADEDAVATAFARAHLPAPARIGTCTAARERSIVVDGEQCMLVVRGWEHEVP